MNGGNALRFAVDEFPSVEPSRLSTTRIVLNTWQHVAATWDGSIAGANIHLYVNGVLADGSPLDGAGVAESDSDTPFAIGNRTKDLARGFDGAIDEVRVYNGVLTAAEIAALAGATPPPVDTTIAGSYPGTGDGGSAVAFNARQEHQRTGLAFANGSVYISWAAHEDKAPWYGWMMGYHYSGTGFSQTGIINVAPNTQEGGIWMGGGAPAVDASGKVYVVTGNGPFDATSGSAPDNDYGDTLLQLTATLAVSQWFTPSDQLSDNQSDKDFGAGGAALLADLPAGNTVTHALICGGKDHSLYVINRDLMGGFGDPLAVQQLNFGTGIFGTPALWNNSLYLAGLGGALQALQLNTATAQFIPGTVSTHKFGFPGATPAVSAASALNGIVWSLDTNQYCTAAAKACGRAVLCAHDAGNVGSELWNSSLSTADAAGLAVKFAVPTVANGRVYVGTRGNNTGGAVSSTSVPGELDIYRLKQ